MMLLVPSRTSTRSFKILRSSSIAKHLGGRYFSSTRYQMNDPLPVVTTEAAVPSTSTVLTEIGQSVGVTANTGHFWDTFVSFQYLNGGNDPLYWFPVRLGEFVLELCQYGLGISWWMTIIVASLGIRTLLIPLQARQLRVQAISQKAAPELRQKMLENQAKAKQGQESLGTWELSRTVYAKYGIHPTQVFIYSLLQVPWMILLFLSLRDMTTDPSFSSQMAFGGALWFTDLTTVRDLWFRLLLPPLP
eukprot:TRINITY_DN2282_c0_g1_i10.p1 TRINITY_DN2282_c0_g1~~TRINITY_DN2282_c0_g1_i10.p1  ORF type:complete len:247 (+),score=29.48 TRINITY_DN2282_c0_g1_i10:102-842(+)